MSRELERCAPGYSLRDQAQTIKLAMLKWTVKFAALTLALCVWGTPLMACLASDTLTEVERECCQQMGDECGSSTMPDSHSCCKTTVQQVDAYLANSRFDFSYSHPAAIQVLQSGFFAAAVQSEPQFFAEESSPPGSPPETISILRI